MTIQSPSFRRATFAVLALTLLATGCASIQVGREFDYGRFSSQVRAGESDLAQIRSLLGEPMGKGLVVEADGTRYDQWTYYYGNGSMSSPEKARFKLLQIRFDPAGKVASYNWSGDMTGSAPVEGK
jgi:outer membrane protein assembly factor BamE (lipoprotein component of BamABCDE complex)